MADIISSDPEFPDNIDNYPAGVELDCLLAERVLGAKVRRYKEWSGYENVLATTPDGETLYIEVSPHSAFGAVPLWNPSTNLLDAETLLQYLYRHSDYRSMTEEVGSENGYSVTLWAQRPIDEEVYSAVASGPTRALAACRAIYKATLDMRPFELGSG